MKRISLLKRFSLISLAAFLIAGFVLGAILASSIEKSAIDQSKHETAHFVTAEVDRVFPGMDFSLPMTGSRYEDFQKGEPHLKFDPSIKRIKVWSPGSVVVWSDERQLVGKQFPNDKELQAALNGAVSSEISSLTKEENRTERQYKRLMELYIPIRTDRDGRVKAVFEIYQDLQDLDSNISRHKRILWVSIAVAFSGIYFACFGIVWQASRRLTEQTQGIEKSEERNRVIAQELTSLLNNVPGVVYRGYGDWSISFIGAEVEQVMGYTAEEFVGGASRWKELIHPSDLDYVKQIFREAVQEKKEVLRTEYRILHKDGSIRWLADRRQLIYDAEGNFARVDGLLLDITRERQLEDQLRQSQKMEAIGTLAGGVAHDFNNLLTVIQGYSDLLLSRLGEGNPLAEEVREIRKASDSASSLTKQMLAFSRMQMFQPKVLDLNDLVANIRKMLARLIGENIELVTFPGENLGRVKADPGQIEQVLMNLVVNARDALPAGGRITIETANVDLDKSFASKQVTFRPGPYVMLTVADTGTGMDEETMSRIFEPFFTTKETGKGTGLGLATVYGIVKQSNGYIWTYSEPGHGTIFKIHLPRVDEQPEEEAPPPQIPARLSGSETVLVVEDTELVRNLVREVLMNYSYTVLEASDGNEALALCGRRKEPIHLLVTDMMMPKMSGADLAQAVSSIRPGIKVLYMSGYTEYGSAENSGLPSGSFFIQKPFSVMGLARKVREVLDS